MEKKNHISIKCLEKVPKSIRGLNPLISNGNSVSVFRISHKPQNDTRPYSLKNQSVTRIVGVKNWHGSTANRYETDTPGATVAPMQHDCCADATVGNVQQVVALTQQSRLVVDTRQMLRSSNAVVGSLR